MVSIYNAYGIINKTVANVAKNTNVMEPAEDVRINQDIIRLEEEDFFVTERGKRLASQLTTAYDLASYRKNFYMVESEMEDLTILEQLMLPIENLDLTEFNLEGESYAVNRNDF